MKLNGDTIAGIVDLFGSLRRGELIQAIEELAFRSGKSIERSLIENEIDRSITQFELVPANDGEDPILVVGPTAFPTLPEYGQDLPHIMTVPDRSVDRTVVEARLVATLVDEIDSADEVSREELREVGWDLQVWSTTHADWIMDVLDQTPTENSDEHT